MIVNGVTLPDIPAEVLEQYPYIFITHGESTLGTEAYTIIASATEFLYMSPDIFPDIEEGLYCLSDSKMMGYDSDEAAWNEDGSVLPAMTNLLSLQNTGVGTMTIIYSNYDIYTVASINADTGEFTKGEIYFPNSEAEEEPEETKPPRYSIATAILDAVARQIMRLTDSTTKVKPEEFEPKLEGINIQLQELTVTATEEVQTITPPSGVYGFSKVIVEAVEDSGGAGGGTGGEGGDNPGDTEETYVNSDNVIFGVEYVEQEVPTGKSYYYLADGTSKGIYPDLVGGGYHILASSYNRLYTADFPFQYNNGSLYAYSGETIMPVTYYTLDTSNAPDNKWKYTDTTNGLAASYR